jgi:hypothetical protein
MFLENLKERGYSEEVVVYRRIILKYIFKKYCRPLRLCIEFI